MASPTGIKSAQYGLTRCSAAALSLRQVAQEDVEVCICHGPYFHNKVYQWIQPAVASECDINRRSGSSCYCSARTTILVRLLWKS